MSKSAQPADVSKIRDEVQKLLTISKEIDGAWKEGARDMMRANTHALSEGVQAMYAAILNNDGSAFSKAAETVRERAFSALIHGRNWRKSQLS